MDSGLTAIAQQISSAPETGNITLTLSNWAFQIKDISNCFQISGFCSGQFKKHDIKNIKKQIVLHIFVLTVITVQIFITSKMKNSGKT